VTSTNTRREWGKAAVRRTAANVLLALRTPALWVLLVASGATLAVAAWTYAAKLRQNDAIARLKAGQDVEIDMTTAPAEVLFARANYLLIRDRLDEAQTIADISAARIDAKPRAALLYNLANARVRAAVADIEKGQLDKAIAHVGLAKTAYRQALHIDPSDWNARYNLDIAMRLVRDFAQVDHSEDGEEAEDQKLWTDLPGVPKGLP
jgi:mxaK protein